MRRATFVILGIAFSACFLPEVDTSETAPDPCVACASAEDSACRDLYDACFGNFDCAQLAQCALDCRDAEFECVADCVELFPDALDPAAELALCVSDECADVCPDLFADPAAGGAGGAGGVGGAGQL